MVDGLWVRWSMDDGRWLMGSMADGGRGAIRHLPISYNPGKRDTSFPDAVGCYRQRPDPTGHSHFHSAALCLCRQLAHHGHGQVLRSGRMPVIGHRFDHRFIFFPIFTPNQFDTTMKRTLIWLLAAATYLTPASTTAQVTDDDEALAYQLKRKYPDERVACTSSAEEYEFDLGKDERQQPLVTALANKKVQFISLREAAMVQHAEFYDKFSAIKKFRQYYKVNNSFMPYSKTPMDKSATSGGIFFDDSRVQYYSIMMPRMGLGSMVEVQKKYHDSKYLTRVMFHGYYPTKEKIIRFKVPTWLQLDIREINFNGFKVEKKQEQEGKFTVYTYRMTDLPPLNSEDHALPAAYTWPHLIILVKSFTANGAQQKGFESAADLYQWYRFLYNQCNNQTASFKSKVDELVRGKNSEADKAKAIFYWVQDNVRYIAFEDGYAGFIPAAAQDVYKNKYGDCKGMANLLTEMLKLAGIKAHFTWIGTRHIPYDYTIPSVCVDNHCIATAYIGGKPVFLDATEKYNPMGEYAYRIQGKEALVGKDEQHEILKVPVAPAGQNKILTQATFTLNDNILKGHLKVTFSGEERTGFLQYYNELPTDRKKEFIQRVLEFGNANLVATNVKTSDFSNRELPVVIEGDIDLSNNVIRDDKELYAGIDFFPRKLSAFMPDDKRMNPYEFNSIYTAEDEIELLLPPGYKVKDMPPPFAQQATDYGFSGSYTASGNKVLLKKTLSISSGRIKKELFDNWKGFLKQLRDFNNNIVTAEKDPNYVAPKPAAAAKPAAVKAPAAKPATTPVKKPVKKQ
jgi:transglutaminase-like putative cysteine protease